MDSTDLDEDDQGWEAVGYKASPTHKRTRELLREARGEAKPQISDGDLKAAVLDVIQASDLTTLTPKRVRQTLEAKLDLDLLSRKAFIQRVCVEEAERALNPSPPPPEARGGPASPPKGSSTPSGLPRGDKDGGSEVTSGRSLGGTSEVEEVTPAEGFAKASKTARSAARADGSSASPGDIDPTEANAAPGGDAGVAAVKDASTEGSGGGKGATPSRRRPGASTKAQPSSSMPLMLPKTLKSKSVAIFQIDDGDLDVCGDTGVIGRMSSSEDGKKLVMDLKGGRREGTMHRCNTLMVVSIGPSEAKVDSAVNDFCRLGHSTDLLHQMRGIVVSGSQTHRSLREEGMSSDEAWAADASDDTEGGGSGSKGGTRGKGAHKRAKPSGSKAKAKPKAKTAKSARDGTKKSAADKKARASREASGEAARSKTKVGPKRKAGSTGTGKAPAKTKKPRSSKPKATTTPSTSKKKKKKVTADSDDELDEPSSPADDSADSDFCP